MILVIVLYLRRRCSAWASDIHTLMSLMSSVCIDPPFPPQDAVARPLAAWMSLHSAARNGDLDAVVSRIADGDDVNLKDKLKRTPLHLAAWAGGCPVAAALQKQAVIGVGGVCVCVCGDAQGTPRSPRL